MKKKVLVSIAMMTVLTTASSVWATEYTYTFSGAALSSWLDGTSAAFANYADTTTDRLTMFNLWGYGNYQTATATDWGEQFFVGARGWTIGSADNNWASDRINDAGTLGKDVLAFGSTTGNAEALASNGGGYPTFSFTLNLDDATIPWYQGNKGELVLWFGGDMADSSNNDRGGLQGNIIMTGEPVPEPATVLLFGAGLAGLAVANRRKNKTGC